MTYKEVEKLLIKNGWYYHHSTGSHSIFKSFENSGIVVVPRHKGDIPKGTINNILKQASLK